MPSPQVSAKPWCRHLSVCASEVGDNRAQLEHHERRECSVPRRRGSGPAAR